MRNPLTTALLLTTVTLAATCAHLTRRGLQLLALADEATADANRYASDLDVAQCALSKAREERDSALGTSRLALAALAQHFQKEGNAEAREQAERHQEEGDTWVYGAEWQWPTGPMSREQARTYAERAATRKPGQCVQLLACVESVQAPEPEALWERGFSPAGQHV